MKTYTQEELKVILDKHQEWLNGFKTGEKADLPRANLSGANLSRANLSEANLSEANFIQANLSRANLYGTSLFRANLFQANLSEANLYRADLSGANLSRADLSQANLFGTNLTFTSIYSFTLGKNFGYYFNGIVTIGCTELPLEQWLKDYKKIGKANGYTDQDIENYGIQLEALSRMKQ